MSILELSRVLMYEFHYVNLKTNMVKYGLLFKDLDSLMYEIKTEDVFENFSNNKEMFDFSHYSTKSKYYNDSNKLVAGNMKVETRGVAIGWFVGFNPKINSFLVNHNSNHQKAKGVNKDVVATVSHTKGMNKDVVAAISHNEYEEMLLNKKCLKHSMNRIPRNDRRIGTNEINKISIIIFLQYNLILNPKGWRNVFRAVNTCSLVSDSVLDQYQIQKCVIKLLIVMLVH